MIPALTMHARERAREMDVSEGLVMQALEAPEQEWPADQQQYPGCRIAIRGDLAVPFDPETGYALTVLWHGAESRAAGPQRRPEKQR